MKIPCAVFNGNEPRVGGDQVATPLSAGEDAKRRVSGLATARRYDGTMRRALVGMLFGVGLAGGGLAIAAPPRSATVAAPADSDAGRLKLDLAKPELRSKLTVTGQQLVGQMDDESARADALARQLADRLAEELAKTGVPVDTKTVDALVAAIAGEAGAAAMALATMLTSQIAELSFIERCDGAKDCDPGEQGVTAAGVKKMRERLAAEKVTARTLLASQKAALAKVTKKRARIEAAFPCDSFRETADAGK